MSPKGLTPAQQADEDRMRHAIYDLGVMPFYDGNSVSPHGRGSDGKCRKCKKEDWPCEAALRMLNAHRH